MANNYYIYNLLDEDKKAFGFTYIEFSVLGLILIVFFIKDYLLIGLFISPIILQVIRATIYSKKFKYFKRWLITQLCDLRLSKVQRNRFYL